MKLAWTPTADVREREPFDDRLHLSLLERKVQPLEELAHVTFRLAEQVLIADHVLGPAMGGERDLDDLCLPQPLMREFGHDLEPVRLRDAAHVAMRHLPPGPNEDRGERRVDHVASVAQQKQEART